MRQQIRMQVIDHYGNKCVCCGETKLALLCLDHINGNGNHHRASKDVQNLSGGFYQWVVQQNYPEGFRVLCHNCNLSIGFYGYCPHQEPKDGEAKMRSLQEATVYKNAKSQQNAEYNRKRSRHWKQQCLEHFGNKCANCTESHQEFLAVDHINGGGRQHRTQLQRDGYMNIHHYLVENEFPDGFQLLCHNCNTEKAFSSPKTLDAAT